MIDTRTNTWTFSGIDRTRYKITAKQAAAIKMLYQDVYKHVQERINRELMLTTYSAGEEIAYLNDLKQDIKAELQKVNMKLTAMIPDNMAEMAAATTAATNQIARDLGFVVSAKMSHVPTDIVASVLSGEVYQKGWSFSNALWKDLRKNTREIDTIVAKGIAENRSAVDIAKDLESFVKPNAARASRKIHYESYYKNGVRIPKKDYVKLTPAEQALCQVKKETYYFGRVDYNAQRLSRTLVSHAYQQSLVNACKPNPFVEGFIWQASNSDRVCPICLERDGKFYKKDELPLDHPNGMCTFTAAIPEMDDVADRLADWVNGADDPAIDNYAAYLGYEDIAQAKIDVEKASYQQVKI